MEKKKEFIINVLFFGLIIAIVYAVCKFLLPALTPFLIAFLIAALIQIPARRLAKGREKVRTGLSVLFCIAVYAAFFLFVISVGVKAVQLATDAALAAPSFYRDTISPMFSEVSDWAEQKVASVDAEASKEVGGVFTELSQEMGQYISEFSVKAVKWLSGGVTEIPNFVIKLVVTIVATFFMAADFPRIIGFCQKMLPEKWRGKTQHACAYVKNVAVIYLRSYSLLFLMTFTELCIGLLLFRIPHAFLIALGIAVFDILPVLGTGGILLPWAAILFVLGNIPLGIGILLLYLVITAVRNTVEPKIVGKQIGLHPLATLIALFAGLELVGVIGVIVFPVSLALLTGLWREKQQDSAEADAQT